VAAMGELLLDFLHAGAAGSLIGHVYGAGCAVLLHACETHRLQDGDTSVNCLAPGAPTQLQNSM
jgi:hypothetical protein